MHVIGCDGVILNLCAEPLSGLIKPVSNSLAIVSKLQQEFLFMATVGNVPDVAWDEMSISSGHEFLLFRVIQTCKLVMGLILTPKISP